MVQASKHRRNVCDLLSVRSIPVSNRQCSHMSTSFQTLTDNHSQLLGTHCASCCMQTACSVLSTAGSPAVGFAAVAAACL